MGLRERGALLDRKPYAGSLVRPFNFQREMEDRTMRKLDTIAALCRIVTMVGREVFRDRLAHDCFCHESNFPDATIETDIISYIDRAVAEKIERDKGDPAIMDWLSHKFGEEWTKLDTVEKGRIGRDYSAAMYEEGCSVAEYARRIGRGNLRAYTDCINAGYARRGRA